MKFTQGFKMAMSSILSNKMRSFLTMLGIIIGISSVIALIAIGEGSKKSVTDAIQGMGTNLLTVSITGSRNKTFTDDELSQIKKAPGIKNIAPEISGSVTVKAGDVNNTTSVEASNADYSEIRNVGVQSGRFITQDDIDNRYEVLDIGTEVIQNLYPDLQESQYYTLLGQSVSINGIPFQIVGILETKGSTAAGSSDNRVIMPLSTGERVLKNKNVRTFYVEATSSSTVDEASSYLQEFMQSKFGTTVSQLTSKNSSTNSQFRIFNQSDLLSTQSATADNMTSMLAGIAAISLVVGGIGIMNIMLVSVTERTKEIGIRKAIGAKRRDILIQFLIEAVSLSCVGGLIGVGLGIAISLILPLVGTQKTVLDPKVMILSFAFSAAVGVGFGLYPASKASKLKPIDALSYE
ncbi:MAG: ABC transporter permease [Bacillota bacterium]|nr:ABC transporter permease [Bacillota bacterium]